MPGDDWLSGNTGNLIGSTTVINPSRGGPMVLADCRAGFEIRSAAIRKACTCTNDYTHPPVAMKYTAILALCVSVIQAEKDAAKNRTMGLESPYDQTAFFVDYGFLLDNYEAIARSPKFKESALRADIMAMIKPIQQYVKSTDDEKVTSSKRKSTIIGMLDFLANKESFSATSIAEDDWKVNQMWNVVIPRTSVEKLMLSRNALMGSIEKERIRVKAMAQYRKALKIYRKTLMGVGKKNFGSLVNGEKIDWSLYADRYMELLPLCRGSKAKKHIPQVRLYFSKWLRDGNQDDEAYEKLEKKLKKTKGQKSDEDKNNASSTLVASASMLMVALISATLLLA